MSSDAIVTIPPEVVRIRASSTVFVKASSRVNRDLAGMIAERIEGVGVVESPFFYSPDRGKPPGLGHEKAAPMECW